MRSGALPRFNLFLAACSVVLPLASSIRHAALRKGFRGEVVTALRNESSDAPAWEAAPSNASSTNDSEHAPTVAESESSKVTYNIRNGYFACLEAPRADVMGTMIHMWLCSGSDHHQAWVYDADTRQIRNVHGLCLDAKDPRRDGGIILMWPCNSTSRAQKWDYNETTRHIKSVFGKCMDAANRTGDSALVQLWQCEDDSLGQRWDIVQTPVDGPESTTPQVPLENLNAKTSGNSSSGEPPLEDDVDPWIATQGATPVEGAAEAPAVDAAPGQDLTEALSMRPPEAAAADDSDPQPEAAAADDSDPQPEAAAADESDPQPEAAAADDSDPEPGESPPEQPNVSPAEEDNHTNLKASEAADAPAPTEEADVSTTHAAVSYVPPKKHRRPKAQAHEAEDEAADGSIDEAADGPSDGSDSRALPFTAENSVVYNIIEPVVLKHFRFITKKLREPASSEAYCVQLSEFLFHTKTERLEYEGTNVIATNPGGENPDVEPAQAAVDGDRHTKWVDMKVQPLGIEFPNPVAVTHFSFITANDFPQRDPLQWLLMGSNDSHHWYDLHDQFEDAEVTKNRNALNPIWFPLKMKPTPTTAE